MKRVPMSREQAAILDEVVIPTLMRARMDDAASQMMTLALAWRFLPEEDPVPDNVIPLVQHSVKV